MPPSLSRIVHVAGPWSTEVTRVPWGVHPFEVAAGLARSTRIGLGSVLTPAANTLRLTFEPSASALEWLAPNAPGIPPGTDERFRFGAYAVATSGSQILLTQLKLDQPDGGLWVLPGGGIDPEEDPASAVLREFHEETGLTLEPRVSPSGVSPQNPELVTVDSEVLGPAMGRTSVAYMRVLYHGTARGKPTVTKTDDSTLDAAWWPLAELPPTNSVVPRALRLLGLAS
jgi:8-oxo-dGTP diphosphatase